MILIPPQREPFPEWEMELSPFFFSFFIYFNMFLYWITPLLCSFQIKYYYYLFFWEHEEKK